MTRRLLLTLAVILGLAGCGSQTREHLSVTFDHPRALTACISSDCGPWSATLNWTIPAFPNTTGYWLFLNGSGPQSCGGTACYGSGSSSPFTFTGSDCGNTVTLGVEAHNSANGHGPLWTISHATPACPSTSTFPLQVSTNGRFLQTASGTPFLMVGDSPQSVVGNLTEAQADAYFADRVTHGFNTIWINLLCADYTGCNANGKALDGTGTAPFTSGTTPASYNIADPSSTYFTAAHQIIADAEADGLEVILDPAETGGWEGFLEANGNGSTGSSNADYQYGVFIGNTFKDLSNIIWLGGNDFADFTQAGVDADVQAVENGIKSVDPTALQTLELSIPADGTIGNTSLDDTTNTGWSTLLNINSAYTYVPTWSDVYHGYGQSPTIPTILAETAYEGQNQGSAENIRLEMWWALTSGAMGNIYGGPCYAITSATTLSSCDTTGVTYLGYLSSLASGLAWYQLAPDTAHTFVWCGSSGTACGTQSNTGAISTGTYTSAALTPDGTLGLIYDPNGATITVNMADMAASTVGRWYDPSNGTFSSITGSPFANTGTHSFATPGTNSAGNSDWVLLLQG